ncbi:DNA repair protein RecO [Actinomarinicola tropica]|uniref:DNA repair protein RecO n=1 Tax=Actinomarinicola tropica TaxID=2789776 RepID=UPI00189A5B5C|nr:DNA repair protein RecO [Actinomarinicola tropica]
MTSKGALYRDHGIVLRTYKLGEADRIIVFATEHHGKVRAVAKGVRKTRSKFGSRLEPTSHVALQLYQGRELDIVTQAESVDHFRPIREDLDRFGRAVAMLEAVDQMAMEREDNPRLYQMLLGALRSLAAHDSPLVVAGFYWKLLAQEGFRPELDVCVSCGEDAELVAFDLMEGGTLCRVCRSGVPISPGALEVMRRILGGQLATALAEPESDLTREVDHLAARAMEHHIERRLRSVGLLDRG